MCVCVFLCVSSTSVALVDEGRWCKMAVRVQDSQSRRRPGGIPHSPWPHIVMSFYLIVICFYLIVISFLSYLHSKAHLSKGDPAFTVPSYCHILSFYILMPSYFYILLTELQPHSGEKPYKSRRDLAFTMLVSYCHILILYLCHQTVMLSYPCIVMFLFPCFLKSTNLSVSLWPSCSHIKEFNSNQSRGCPREISMCTCLTHGSHALLSLAWYKTILWSSWPVFLGIIYFASAFFSAFGIIQMFRHSAASGIIVSSFQAAFKGLQICERH